VLLRWKKLRKALMHKVFPKELGFGLAMRHQKAKGERRHRCQIVNGGAASGDRNWAASGDEKPFAFFSGKDSRTAAGKNKKGRKTKKGCAISNISKKRATREPNNRGSQHDPQGGV